MPCARRERSITFETYIYWSGDIGHEFADALAERARAGVKVHVLVDWVGSQRMDDGHAASGCAPSACRSSATIRCTGTTWRA